MSDAMNTPVKDLVVTEDQQTENISDAVWGYMTSVKEVQKRDGSTQAFDHEKLESSIASALKEAGMKHARIAEDITKQVITRLVKRFDGHSTPTYADVREVVNLTFIDHNLMHVAKAYLQHDVDKYEVEKEPSFGQGVSFERHFTTPGVHPYDAIEWELRDARITNEKGEIIFEQKDVEVPAAWSQAATNIVVSKYFRGKVGDSDRECSAKQLISRVATTMANWGRYDGYFNTPEDADIFEAELTHLLINQMCAFNSPVWFNVGVVSRPQCSACFINSVEDDMRSILNLCTTEGMLFKGGSGTGTNLSTLRSKYEYLRGSNGRASGPVSFMKGFDAFAGVIKSGGKTRRAAKMVMLNIDHPDIDDFIKCKAEEERKAWTLMDAGYDGSIDGDAYGSIYFQNANHSVRVSDDFMRAVQKDEEWVTREVMTKEPSVTFKAKDLMRMMAESAWQCGDPGIQYDTIINKWHTCSETDAIHGSNPCSEYMFLNDSACNLASLNLMKFRKSEDGKKVFDITAFRQACEVIITAMEIVIDNSSYPTPSIERNSHDYRPLGIGYANLGALLMSSGVAYDSEEGRNLAAGVTALLSGYCYHQSSKIAKERGSFEGYAKNEGPFLKVMHMHRDHACQIKPEGITDEMRKESCLIWNQVIEHGRTHGFRNAQISVLAPTGTIAFLMDCDTTGVEPDIALVKYKWLVGGGMMKIVNGSVKEALHALGYNASEQAAIMAYIDEKDTIEGAPGLKEEHLGVFDCAFKPANGTRTIHYMGHLRMMGAVQPFLSGAISKTVNMPHESTVEDIEFVYQEGWRMGLKAIAIYRDGSKRQQALTTSKEKDSKKANTDTDAEGAEAEKVAVSVAKPADNKPRRRRMPDERRSITHKFCIGNHEGYINVGLYDDGKPGEIFITMSKQGSVIRGLMDSFATSVSIGLQYGVPLDVLVDKFVHMRFEPSGYTNNPNIRIAKSIVDYLFRWMSVKFLPREQQIALGIQVEEVEEEEEKTEGADVGVDVATGEIVDEKQTNLFEEKAEVQSGLTATFDNQSDAPACDTCGSMMVRNGACYKCLNCGATSGCS